MWMAVYVRPPRPHVPVINHCPHRPPTGLVKRDRLFKMAPDQSECAWKCTDECQTRGCFHLQMSPLRKAVPNDAMMSVKQAGSCWRAVSSVSVAEQLHHDFIAWAHAVDAHMLTLLPVSSGTFTFPFLMLLGCNGNKCSFVCGSAGPEIFKKNTFEGVESFPSRWKKRENLPEWRFGVILWLPFYVYPNIYSEKKDLGHTRTFILW